MSPVADAAALVRDLIGLGVWLVFLVGGLWGLRWSQKAGWI